LAIAAESIDQLYYTVTRITTHYYTDSLETDSHEVMKPSGFFYCNRENRLFLITNRHVIIDEDHGYFPNVIRIRIHTNRSDLRQNEYYDIHLYNKSKKMWIESAAPADVVCGSSRTQTAAVLS